MIRSIKQAHAYRFVKSLILNFYGIADPDYLDPDNAQDGQ
jgi:hypothetical protein